MGTDWTNTGTNGAGGLQAGAAATTPPGSGAVTVTLGAHLNGSDTDVFGVTAGSEGTLSVTSGGVVSDARPRGGSGGHRGLPDGEWRDDRHHGIG